MSEHEDGGTGQCTRTASVSVVEFEPVQSTRPLFALLGCWQLLKWCKLHGLDQPTGLHPYSKNYEFGSLFKGMTRSNRAAYSCFETRPDRRQRGSVTETH